MPRCTRKGCGQEYADDAQDACKFHRGTPVFHEGLKSWSCCQDINKPVLDFDEFMKLPGCTIADRHTAEPQQAESEASKKQTITPNVTLAESTPTKEVYTTTLPAAQSITPARSPAPPTPVVEEEDDPSAPVNPGTTCRRKGCGVQFVSDEVNRLGDGDGTACQYHPSPPIFREGSKGYLCCKRRVLEFDEFLKIEGCKKGRHVFVPKKNDSTDKKDELTSCRIDHYQTVDKVHVSIFAKQVDKERSTIKMEGEQVSFDLYLPGAKRFVRTLDLFGPIDPTASSFQYFGTKVELHLQKLDGRSWTILEKTDQDLGNISLTFGVGGRTGSTGAKELVLDETNKLRT